MNITQPLNSDYRGSVNNTRYIKESQVLLPNYNYQIDTTSGSFTVYLPQQAPNGTIVKIINPNNSFATNPVTVAILGTDTINGNPNIVLNNNRIIEFNYFSLLRIWSYSAWETVSSGNTQIDGGTPTSDYGSTEIVDGGTP